MITLNKTLSQNFIMKCIDPDGITLEYKSFQDWDYALLRKGLDGNWAIAYVGDYNSMQSTYKKRAMRSSRISYALVSFIKVGA